MSLVLVTGGARAGKSTFAEGLARELGGEYGVTYVATAAALDADMAQRIAAHRAARPAGWLTVEARRGVAERLRAAPTSKVVLLDCMTILVSNILLAHRRQVETGDVWPAVEAETAGLIGFQRESGAAVIVVTNEVGLGVVPPTRLGRMYRDLLGRANQQLAAVAEAVYLLVSGIPIELKSRDARRFSGRR